MALSLAAYFDLVILAKGEGGRYRTLGDLLAAARGDLLARAGHRADAITALDHAIQLAPTDLERRQLVRRRDELR